jgi:hypothetical protein
MLRQYAASLLGHDKQASSLQPPPTTHRNSQAFTAVDEGAAVKPEAISKFLSDPVHQALAKCSEMRPSVDISVGGEGSSVGVGAGAARVAFRSSVAA